MFMYVLLWILAKAKTIEEQADAFKTVTNNAVTDSEANTIGIGDVEATTDFLENTCN